MAAINAFEASAAEIAELFSDYLEDKDARPVFVLSHDPIDSIARNALEKSFESFGFPPEPCTYATLLPKDCKAEGGDIALDPQTLFTLVEALDPLRVIATDAESSRVIAVAYRIELPTAEAAPVRIFGRPAVAFRDLAESMQTENGKQTAWRALKSLA